MRLLIFEKYGSGLRYTEKNLYAKDLAIYTDIKEYENQTSEEYFEENVCLEATVMRSLYYLTDFGR